MSASAELAWVAPPDVAKVWPYVAHLIAGAMRRGGMGRFEDVARDVLGSNAYLWVAIDGGAVLAAAVTKVTAEQDHRLCTIVACGGRQWRRWGRLIEGLE